MQVSKPFVGLALAIFLAGGGCVFADEVTVTERKAGLSESDALIAELWDLSENEFARYKQILKSPRAYFTPNLDKNPLLALALEARSAEERSRYADRWVQIQSINNIKVIGWQLEVSQAWQRLYPDTPRFSSGDHYRPGLRISEQLGYAKAENPDPVANGIFNQKPQSLGFDSQALSSPSISNNRASIFLTLDCGDKCNSAFQDLYSQVKSGSLAGVDVFFVGSIDSIKAGRWAISQSVTVADVSNEPFKVTLNASDEDVRVPKVIYE